MVPTKVCIRYEGGAALGLAWGVKTRYKLMIGEDDKIASIVRLGGVGMGRRSIPWAACWSNFRAVNEVQLREIVNYDIRNFFVGFFIDNDRVDNQLNDVRFQFQFEQRNCRMFLFLSLYLDLFLKKSTT